MRFGRRTYGPWDHDEVGTGMRWYASSFFDSALSRASISPRGLQPGVRRALQLQVADHVLVEDRNRREVLEQVEGDVGLPLFDAGRMARRSSPVPSGPVPRDRRHAW